MDHQDPPTDNSSPSPEIPPTPVDPPIPVPLPRPQQEAYRLSDMPEQPERTFSAYVPSSPPPPPPSPARTPTAPPRRNTVSLLLFVLVFLVGLLMIPNLAEQIAYSLNRGKERAQADIARKLLDEVRDPEQRIPWVAKLVAPSVVGIRTLAQNKRGEVGMDVGSGVIVDVNGKIGYILTNNHVIANAQIVTVKMNDGRIIEEAEVIGRDQATDLAVLRIDDSQLKAIAWGDSSRINVGDQVIAIGNPFDLGQTVTSGIISATERYNPLPSQTRVQEFLQTDAAINPGNSGGPLVDLKGELIGINTAIFSQTGGSLGIGFAIPSILAKRVYEEIRSHGQVQHGWLGIEMAPTTPRMAEQAGLGGPKGVVVAGFFPYSPAREAGLKVGDIILQWGEVEIRDPLHLSHVIVLAKPGTREKVEVFRKGERLQIEITLGTRAFDLN